MSYELTSCTDAAHHAASLLRSSMFHSELLNSITDNLIYGPVIIQLRAVVNDSAETLQRAQKKTNNSIVHAYAYFWISLDAYFINLYLISAAHTNVTIPRSKIVLSSVAKMPLIRCPKIS